MLTQSDEASEIPADPTQWMYSVTKQESVPIANDFLIDSGAATSVCQQSLANILSGKPRGPGVELRSDTGHQFTTTGSTTICLRTRDCVNPRTLDCKGRLSRWDKCVTEAISSSAAVLVEPILNEFTGNRIEFERAGGVYRLRAGTSAKMQSGPGEVKVLMGFQRDVADTAEAQPARPGIVPVLPSEAEVEQHELTHLPFRSWCRHCVRAKGKESPHHESSPGGVSKFATDYMFMVEDGRPITISAGYDGLTKAFFANVVPCKGTSHGYAARALAHDLLSRGHQKVILQSDQEPSIIDVKHKADTHISTEIVDGESPVGDSNANGSIERANQTIQGQIRAIKDYTERQIGATIGLDSSVLTMACTSCSMNIDDIPR